MFTLNRDIELTETLLTKMLNQFFVSVRPKLQHYKNYYDGLQAVLQKTYTDTTKPCNRTVTNFCKNITDSYCGYIASAGYITYNSEQPMEEILDTLRYNDYQTEDSDFLLDALIYGVAAELVYIDTDGKTRFKLIKPTDSFGVFDDSLTNDLLYFVRFYKKNEWAESDDYIVDVYSDNEVRHYEMYGLNGGLRYTGTEPHYFNQCPANIFYLPDEKAIFDCVMGLQDSYNEIITSEIDDYSAFVDAFLALNGVDAETDDIRQMKENRVLILPEGASAEWLTKNASDTQVENILKRLNDSIYRIASCPDFSSETFVGGVSSGVAIRYRLTGMETRAARIAALMKKALQRRIEIICGIASLRLGEEVFRDVEIVFTRNIPTDNTDIVNLVRSLTGIVSDETLLSMIPQVTDIPKELERLKAQKEENMALYDFGGAADGEK